MDEGTSGIRAARGEAARRTARVKRWVAGAALALTGIFSAVAAHALPANHSKPHSAAGAAPSIPPASGDGSAQPATPSIAPPAEAPQPSVSGAGAVSGGS
jgi:hypothetical protein